MKLSSFIDSCKQIPDFMCQCQDEGIFMCKNHANNHLSIEKYKIHHLIPALKEVNSNMKSMLLKTLKEIIKKTIK